MKIPEYNETNSLAEAIANLILKSVLKYNKNPSATAVRNLNIRSQFEFPFVNVDEIPKEIKKINPHEAVQSTDAPV